VAYDPVHDHVYVANSLADSVTVIDASSRTVVVTLDDDFSRPFHLAANPATGRVYVTNFDSHSVTVVDGATVSKVVDLYDSVQPYGIAVDETRDLVYVATVAPHRIVVIGSDPHRGVDQFYGWAAFYRGFGDRNRPVPLRAIAVNPNAGSPFDGGHIWSTTATGDDSEADQALLIPKGWWGYFHVPIATTVSANPTEGIAVDRTTNRVYVTGGISPGTVTVVGDHGELCPTWFLDTASVPEHEAEFDFDLFSVAAQAQGDVTGDGQVDIFDLSFIAARYDTTDPAADLNTDGQVDIFDLVIAANNFGQQVQ
jgi:YVTN family beta-propeller protein